MNTERVSLLSDESFVVAIFLFFNRASVTGRVRVLVRESGTVHLMVAALLLSCHGNLRKERFT